MTNTNITAKEAALLTAIATSDYQSGDAECAAADLEPVWSFDLGPAASVGGVMASLSNKGLVICEGSGKDAQVELTRSRISGLQGALVASNSRGLGQIDRAPVEYRKKV